MKGYREAQDAYDNLAPEDDHEFDEDEEEELPAIWFCCGGIELNTEDHCPICREEY